jgi:pyruvate-formate lyase-activating enzyme
MNALDLSGFARTLSIMPTYRCTAECTHCGTGSNPRDTTSLQLEEMCAAIDQAAKAGYGTVVFTGGEPTLAGSDLLQSMRHAALLGLRVRIVTNAHWAANDDAAVRRVNDFVCAGLAEINFSTGDQHARFVALKNIFHATRAAVAAGLGVSIIVETVKTRSITRESVVAHPEFTRILEDFPFAEVQVLEWVWTPLSPYALEQYPDGFTANKTNIDKREGCDNVLTTMTLHADGNLSACCGVGARFIRELTVGNIRKMNLAEADRIGRRDFLKQRIRAEGPERILAWAGTYDPEIIWENMYAHRCQACVRLHSDPKVRRIIAEQGGWSSSQI